MKTEIPEFLIEMSEQMNKQNNRVTADPLFEVRYKKYIPTEEDINESHWELYHTEDEGMPTYSSNGNGVSDDYLYEFYETNEKWCDSWLSDRGFSANPIEFKDHFDFDEFKDEGCGDEWPDGYNVIHLQEIEVTLNSHFTEVGAQQFIDRKQHDYPKLYIYAISLCYCNQMTELRNWIKDLKTN